MKTELVATSNKKITILNGRKFKQCNICKSMVLEKNFAKHKRRCDEKFKTENLEQNGKNI